MANQYLNYISDEHLLNCIDKLYQSYRKGKISSLQKKHHADKMDAIKLMFDAKFNGIDEEKRIEYEVFHQVEESINNSIGTFHEQILGGIEGFEVGNLSGFDVKAKDNTLFALFQFERIPSNFQDAIFEKLAKQAQLFKQADCYLVDFTKEDDYLENWAIKTEESSVGHKRVFKVSLKQFYAKITREEAALFQLCQALPGAIESHLTVSKSQKD